MELNTALRGIRARWMLVLLLTVLTGAAAYSIGTRTDPVYAASTSVLVGNLSGSKVNSGAIRTSRSLAQTYADLTRRDPVLQETITELGLRMSSAQLREQVHVRLPPQNPQLIIVSAEGDSPDKAKAIAGGIASRLIAMGPREDSSNRAFVKSQLHILQDDIQEAEKRVVALTADLTQAAGDKATTVQTQIGALQEQITQWRASYIALRDSIGGGQDAASLRVLEQAQAQKSPVRPNVPSTTVVAAAVGMLLGCALAYALEVRSSLDNSRGLDSTAQPESPLNHHTIDNFVPRDASELPPTLPVGGRDDSDSVR
jgi:capsular polysaccharide biosynthesis protein